MGWLYCFSERLAKILTWQGAEPTDIRAEVGWNSGDGGYWGAARMALESSLALALEGNKLDADPKCQKGGVLTPATGLGETLVQRLKQAGFFFNIVEP